MVVFKGGLFVGLPFFVGRRGWIREAREARGVTGWALATIEPWKTGEVGFEPR